VNVRRARPLPEPLERAAWLLRRSEAEVALLDRVRPLNWSAELARLLAAARAGRATKPAFEYAPRPELRELRQRLSALGSRLDAGDAEQRLLGERARELELEAALCEHVADAEFKRLAAERFPLPAEPGHVQDSARALLSERASTPELAGELLHISDDARDPSSLWSQVRRQLGQELGEVRVLAVAGLVSLAAVAEGVVRIRAGQPLSASTARRIALHEVEGHVRPRARGQRLGGVFMAGAASASEDEEGRAILLEQRAGFLVSSRRRELARRYLAAESVRQGADFWETLGLLDELGGELPASVELASRVHRGGGLGRELVYLTGYLRVKAAFEADPERERVMKCGRLSLSAAAELAGSLELDDDGNVI
jgi:hypothetical protein